MGAWETLGGPGRSRWARVRDALTLMKSQDLAKKLYVRDMGRIRVIEGILYVNYLSPKEGGAELKTNHSWCIWRRDCGGSRQLLKRLISLSGLDISKQAVIIRLYQHVSPRAGVVLACVSGPAFFKGTGYIRRVRERHRGYSLVTHRVASCIGVLSIP